MTQWWLVEKMAEQRRADLTQEFRASAKRVRRHQEMSGAAPLQVVGSAEPWTRPDRSEHTPVGHHLGNWLIRAGTRLGGASIRTS